MREMKKSEEGIKITQYMLNEEGKGKEREKEDGRKDTGADKRAE